MSITYALISPASAKDYKKENRHSVAVIIGNAHYSQLDDRRLDVAYAVNDARAMKRFLIDRLGYRSVNILYKENASTADMRSFFGTERRPGGKLLNRIRPGQSNVFVYYAGHGAPDVEYDEPFLIPTDVSPNEAYNGYSLVTLEKTMEKVRKKIGPEREAVVMLDACFSGESAAGLLLEASSAFVSFKLPQVRSNVVYLRASAKDQVANWNKDEELSLFTSVFLSGVDGAADGSGQGSKDGRVSWQELNSYLAYETPLLSLRLTGRKQQPEVEPDANISWSLDVEEGRTALKERECERQLATVDKERDADLTTLRAMRSTINCPAARDALRQLIRAAQRDQRVAALQLKLEQERQERLRQQDLFERQQARLRERELKLDRERRAERQAYLKQLEQERARRRTQPAPRSVPQRQYTPPASPGVTFRQLPNTDIVGRGLDIQELRNVSIATCKQRCAALSNCAQFNYDARNNWCWLKRRGGKRIYDKRGFSMVKVTGSTAAYSAPAPSGRSLSTEWNADYYGGDYRNLRKVSSARCSSACASDSRCRAFTWVPNKGRHRGTGRCWMKSQVGRKSYMSGTFAGIKR